MRLHAFIIFAIFGLAPAHAQTQTVDVTFQDQGFSNGLQLRSRESANVFFSLPNASDVLRPRLRIQGQIATPNLARGSLLIASTISRSTRFP